MHLVHHMEMHFGAPHHASSGLSSSLYKYDHDMKKKKKEEEKDFFFFKKEQFQKNISYT